MLSPWLHDVVEWETHIVDVQLKYLQPLYDAIMSKTEQNLSEKVKHVLLFFF